jgi:hypothetical protein
MVVFKLNASKCDIISSESYMIGFKPSAMVSAGSDDVETILFCAKTMYGI